MCISHITEWRHFPSSSLLPLPKSHNRHFSPLMSMFSSVKAFRAEIVLSLFTIATLLLKFPFQSLTIPVLLKMNLSQKWNDSGNNPHFSCYFGQFDRGYALFPILLINPAILPSHLPQALISQIHPYNTFPSRVSTNSPNPIISKLLF